MRKTKIVCTLGPATDDIQTLKKMVKMGMNVARLNFSHDVYENHERRINAVKAVRKELNVPIAIMLDSKGPEIRVKAFKAGSVMLNEGQTFVLTSRDVLGDENEVSITYPTLYKSLKVSDRILADDGMIEFEVTEIKGTDIVCTVLAGGTLSTRKSINIPNVPIEMPYMTEIDKQDFLFGIKNDVDYIAASFVRSKEDVIELRAFLDKNGGNEIDIIAKIENRQGVDNIVEIINNSDGIMVARGDMGVEIPFVELPAIQKSIIKTCYKAGKKVITATQMLESMIKSPRPTRAEISDVANAVYDGTSATMLSGETAVGKYPVEAIRTMAAIVREAENNINYRKRFSNLDLNNSHVSDAICHATCSAAHDLNAKAIIVVTRSGRTARMVSRFRPDIPIISATTSEKAYNKLSINWGVTAIRAEVQTDTDALFVHVNECAKKAGLVKKGDLCVICSGPIDVRGITDMLKVLTIQ